MRLHSLFLLAFFLVSAGLNFNAGTASAADDKRVKKHVRPVIGEEIALPEIGIRFRIFKHCTRTPVPVYESSYRADDPAHERKIVKISAYWRYVQTAALFTSDEGAAIRIYTPRLLLWSKPEKYMAEARFQEWAAKAENMIGKENFDLPGWLNRAAGGEWKKCTSFEIKSGKNVTLDALESFDPETGDAYAVCAAPADAPERRVVLFFRLPAYSAADEKPAMRIMENIVSSIAFFPPREQPDGELKKTPPKSGKTEPDLKQLRGEQVRETLKNLPDWWTQETGHFIIASNVRKRKGINFLREDVEKFHAALLKLLPPLQENPMPGVIRVFESKAEYLSYTEQEKYTSPCVWQSRKQEVVCFFDPEIRRGEDMDRRTKNLHYSMFQQYFAGLTGGCGAHSWFTSGGARLFSNLACRQKDRVSLPLDKEELESISEKMRSSRYADVRRLLLLSNQDFSKEHKAAAPVSYALMIFLCKGAPLLKDAGTKDAFSAIPYRYLRTLMETHDQEKAKEAAWSGIDMKKFNAEFADFWSNKNRYGKMKNDDIAPLSEQRLPASERKSASGANGKK